MIYLKLIFINTFGDAVIHLHEDMARGKDKIKKLLSYYNLIVTFAYFQSFD